MTELTPEKKKRLQRLAKVVKTGNLGIFEYLNELEDQFQATVEEIKKTYPDVNTVLQSIKGKDGTNGKDSQVPGPKGEDSKVPGPQGQEGRPGKDGKDSQVPGPKGDKGDPGQNGQDGKNGVDGNIKEVSPQEVRDLLELLQGDERLDVSAIKGLDERLKKIPQALPTPAGGVMGRDLVRDIDLSDQLDGIKSTFNIAAVWTIISVDLSSYPYGSLRKNVDYTWTPTAITFTATIDPATQLAAGQSCVLTVVNS